MKLWIQWGQLIVCWFFSYLSMGIWPKMDELDLHESSDFFTAVLFHPFHYIAGFMFMIFFVFLSSYILRKLIYECQVAYLFRRIPYEALLLFLGLAFLFFRMLHFYTFLIIAISIVVAIYDIMAYLPKRNKDVIYVKE